MRVHVLIIHPEKAMGGAEKMLEYFLPAIASRSFRVTVAVAEGPLSQRVPKSAEAVVIPDHQKFSVSSVFRQVRLLNRIHRQHPIDIVHGWAARDWELSSLVGAIWRRPVLGTLHDHPAASYIRRRRRWLMRAVASRGLRRVVCVSEAVRRACEAAGYRPDRLTTILNGLPEMERAPDRSAARAGMGIQLGYLGGLTPAKGIEDLLAVMDCVAGQTRIGWELRVGGAPSTHADDVWLAKLKAHYAQRSWWPRVTWLGWVNRPADFLRSLDLLLFTSSSFDSLPTVLLEAARVGTPVLASAVGGAPEIVEQGVSGWLFEPGNVNDASNALLRIMTDRSRLEGVGKATWKRAAAIFAVDKMVEGYENLYLNGHS